MMNFEQPTNEIELMTDQELTNTFRKMSDDELHLSAVKTSEKERRVTLILLKHLNEIERRHLYSKFSCSSLHAYCVKELKMDDGTAGRRVSAARLLKEVPVIEEKILLGSMTLTSVAQAGIFFRKEAVNGNRLNVDEKKEIVLELENKSTREVDKLLLSKSETPEIHFKERIIPKTETTTEVRLHFDEETMAALTRLKEIWSHANPYAGFADIIKRASAEAVEKHDPLRKIARSDARKAKANSAQVEATPAQKCKLAALEEGATAPEQEGVTAEVKERAVTSAPKCEAVVTKEAVLVQTYEDSGQSKRPFSKAEIKREVWSRDQAQCTQRDLRTGERCQTKHFVEEDHIIPKAMGGEYSVENLRLRCRAHNQRHAIDCYGVSKMQAYLN
jgi:hypothetical protein